MNINEKEQLKSAMERKKEELSKLLDDLKDATKPMGLDSAIGRISRMDYINNKAINEAGIRKIENDLHALDHWLSLYGTDKFGRCARCGNEINFNRLLLLPASSRCINCA
jgi:DnaK suppressor protein